MGAASAAGAITAANVAAAASPVTRRPSPGLAAARQAQPLQPPPPQPPEAAGAASKPFETRIVAFIRHLHESLHMSPPRPSQRLYWGLYAADKVTQSSERGRGGLHVRHKLSYSKGWRTHGRVGNSAPTCISTASRTRGMTQLMTAAAKVYPSFDMMDN